MRFWKLALLAAVGLSLATPSRAVISSVKVKTDTLALYARDSSAVMDVSRAKRMWLDIIAVPLTCAGCDSAALHASDSINAVALTTTIVLAVQAREVLTSAAATDSTYAIRLAADAALTDPAYSATIQHTSEHSTAAAYSDTTVVPWNPHSITVSPGLADNFAANDSVWVNSRGATNDATSSSEIRASIRGASGVWSSNRSVRVDFVNPESGAPFVAQLASFRWRELAGPAGYVRLRVVLGMETQ